MCVGLQRRLLLKLTAYLSFEQQEKADDENNQLFVFFPEDEKVGVKPIKILTDRMKDENVSNAIMVLRGDITPFAKQAVMEMSDSFRIEHFKEAELLVDITEHTLVSDMSRVWLIVCAKYHTCKLDTSVSSQARIDSLTKFNISFLYKRSQSTWYYPKMKSKNY